MLRADPPLLLGPAPAPGPALERRLGIYVHWPFCVSKCPYCDFNSHVAEAVDQRRWCRALLRELEHGAAEAGDGRIVVSLFFGGGTPSLMDPETVAVLIAAVRSRWPVGDDLEITLEANPSSAGLGAGTGASMGAAASVDAGRLTAFRDAGVNRLSLGVQSLDDDVLAFLGRAHSAAEARRAASAAAAVFPRWSIDLIYGWADHEPSRWRRQLGEALALAGDHLSAYQLTIEPGTAFHKQRIAVADDDTAADLWELTGAMTAAAGFAAYEISNYARPAGACRHNLAIWQGGDYLGIGPGAHGRVTGVDGTRAIQRHSLPHRWLAAVETGGHGTNVETLLSPSQRAEELVLIGLRLSDGLDRQAMQRLTGRSLEQLVDGAALAQMQELGLVEVDARGLRLSSGGRLCLDAVARALLTAVAEDSGSVLSP